MPQTKKLDYSEFKYNIQFEWDKLSDAEKLVKKHELENKGVSYSTLRKYARLTQGEQGRVEVDTLLKIAKALKLDFEGIFNYELHD